MHNTTFTTIPKAITGREELVVVPRRVFDLLLESRVREEKLLRWSREAKKLKREGKLSVLRSLKDMRRI